MLFLYKISTDTPSGADVKEDWFTHLALKQFSFYLVQY